MKKPGLIAMVAGLAMLAACSTQAPSGNATDDDEAAIANQADALDAAAAAEADNALAADADNVTEANGG